MKIGIVGYSSNQIDEQLAAEILEPMINRMTTGCLHKSQVEIVTGLTNIGIPKLAYHIADKYKFLKIGISAQQAYRVKCGIYPVDKTIIVGEFFGDESQAFVDYIDCLIRLGGGKQSASEVNLFKEKCEQLEWNIADRLHEAEFQLLEV